MIKFLIIALMFHNPLLDSDRKEKTDVIHEAELVDVIFDAYKDYKSDQLEVCNKKMERSGFQISKKASEVVPGDIKIDSLIFSDRELQHHVFVTSVDLGYLKNVSGSVTMKSANARWLAERFLDKITESNLQATVEYDELAKEYTVRDNNAFIVYDDRWQEETTTMFPSFYTCRISIIGDYMDISFEEVVPRKFVIVGEDLITQNNMTVGL
jgi:hypothetical protein